MSTTDVNTVVTDSDLEGVIGADELANILPDSWADAKPARQSATHSSC